MTSMEKSALLAPAFLLMLAGCDAAGPLPEVRLPGEEAYVSVRLNIQSSPPGTRGIGGSTSPVADDIICDGVILEFDPDGVLLELVQFAGENIPEVRVRRNQQTDIYIVANPTVDLAQVASLSDFLDTRSSYQANEAGRLEMTGHFCGSFGADAAVNVRMERMVSRIQVDRMVFRCTHDWPDYTGIHFTRGYLEKTPDFCTYGLFQPGTYINAYDRRIGIGYTSGYSSEVRNYDQGEYKVWEYIKPWSVYCYPNEADDANGRSRLAISYRLVYQVTGIDAATGQPVVLPRYDDACLHLVLPRLRPNTVYELERLTLNGPRNRVVYLGGNERHVPEPPVCSFGMRDMTTGEYLGSVEGEVEYALLDN